MTTATEPRLRLFESPSGRQRRERAAAFLAGFPPGTEILVVAPTRDVGDDLIRRHAPESTFGIHRYGFRQLVATVAASELAASGLTPATSLGLEAVAARATFDALERGVIPRLEEVAQTPGFPQALAATLDELRLSGLDAAPLDGAGASAAELKALAGEFEQEVERARIADAAVMLRLATWAWRRPHWATLRQAPILLLDLALPTRREREFIESIVRSSPAVLATVPAGDRDTVAALVGAGAVPDDDAGSAASIPAPATETRLHRLGRWLFSDDDPPAPDDADDDTVHFLSAPGEGRECVEIARRLRDEAAAGVPFDEMAVFLRSPETYSAHLETAFRRAGIPAWFARGTRRPDPSGRAFLALLACRAERLSAKRFSEYLSFAQVPDLAAGGAPPAEKDDAWVGPAAEELGPSTSAAQLSLFGAAPADVPPPAPAPDDDTPAHAGTLRAPWKWEELLVEAAVIGERDRWKRRLDGLAAEYAKKLDELSAHDPESARAVGLKRDLANLGHLERFALPVIDALAALPERAAWREWLLALERLAPRVLRSPDRVLEVLAEMRPMAEVGPVGVNEVRAVLADRLTTLEDERPAHRYGRVFVSTARGAGRSASCSCRGSRSASSRVGRARIRSSWTTCARSSRPSCVARSSAAWRSGCCCAWRWERRRNASSSRIRAWTWPRGARACPASTPWTWPAPPAERCRTGSGWSARPRPRPMRDWPGRRRANRRAPSTARSTIWRRCSRSSTSRTRRPAVARATFWK
jgi:hypothetical protein